MLIEKRTIVFYDGECGLCNRLVGFILKHERNSDLYFTALQSRFAQNIFELHFKQQPDFDTFYLLKDGVFHERSSAAIELCSYLKKSYSWLRIMKLIPRRWRDSIYAFVAKRRKNISNKSCVVPTSEQLKRFLDNDLER
jgi:predicted DCC family thiol-disulfide oxidoreductase YuxK